MAEIQIMEYVVVKYRRNFLGLFIRLQSLPGGKEEHLIDLGFECRGGIAKARWSCIDTWFHIRGSNKYEASSHKCAPSGLATKCTYFASFRANIQDGDKLFGLEGGPYIYRVDHSRRMRKGLF
ncbi:uncharacterized protein LOC131316246 isoform X8 [Rhododendron vialii]|uniref:uncharacterized protein LOC131316246 isoform X8 n=1 Tax=Rhododendron vialii TaxID=182163 RepID=UPI00265D8A62|nr:uncharacterized protein LOC131316246 isoform X8 [Rhododendron vialii]